MPIHDRTSFENLYAGQPRWEIGRPQKALLDVTDQITGSILDSGCGTGENALFFASRGHKVMGIDFLAEPISLARQKATERGLTATFLVMDALALKDLPEVFDTVIDSGLFHVFSDDDRRRYVDGLASVLKPGGKLFLLCFSDQEPGTQGPRRVSEKEIRDAFAEGWKVESIEPSRFEVRPDLKDITFNEGGPKSWFVVARRVGDLETFVSKTRIALDLRRNEKAFDVWLPACHACQEKFNWCSVAPIAEGNREERGESRE